MENKRLLVPIHFYNNTGKIEVTKEDNLFKLKADDIINNYKDACVALARALFFFQTP